MLGEADDAPIDETAIGADATDGSEDAESLMPRNVAQFRTGFYIDLELAFCEPGACSKPTVARYRRSGRGRDRCSRSEIGLPGRTKGPPQVDGVQPAGCRDWPAGGRGSPGGHSRLTGLRARSRADYFGAMVRGGGPRNLSGGLGRALWQVSYAACRSIRFLTVIAYQAPPRAVRTPRSLSASAIPARVVTPLARIFSTIGSTLPAN